MLRSKPLLWGMLRFVAASIFGQTPQRVWEEAALLSKGWLLLLVAFFNFIFFKCVSAHSRCALPALFGWTWLWWREHLPVAVSALLVPARGGEGTRGSLLRGVMWGCKSARLRGHLPVAGLISEGSQLLHQPRCLAHFSFCSGC